MCKSRSDGGQRCAAHTRPRFEAATFGTEEWDNAAAEFASTPTGEMELAEQAITAQLADQTEQSVALYTALERGRSMRAMNGEVADAIHIEALQLAHLERVKEWEARSAEIAARHNINDIPVEQWHERKMCIFDLESTGKSPHDDRMVTASIIEVFGNPNNPDNIVVREWMVNPGVDIPEGAAEIHGVTTERAKAEGLSPAQVARELNVYMKSQQDQGVPIVAFNGFYDMTMLDAESERHGLAPTERIAPDEIMMIDPMVIDKAAAPYASGGRKLVAVAARYGVPEFDAHNSSADCIATAKVAHALAISKPSLQVHPKRLHAWQIKWQEQWNNKMTEYVATKGGTQVFDNVYGILPRPVIVPEAEPALV